jgi:putative membrane protein
MTSTEKKIEHSAEVIKESAIEQVDSADRRTELAANRTVLAAERTYAAWIRTGVVTLASGLGAKAVFADEMPPLMVSALASAFVLIAGICFGVAVWRLNRAGAMPPTPDVPQLPTALLAGIGWALLLIVVLTLFTVWVA